MMKSVMPRQDIPAIAELRQRVDKSEAQYGRSPWISKRVIHPHVSIYLTRLFLLLDWTGNQVTLVMMACAFIGPALFFIGSTHAYVTGALLMLLSWVLDHTDGEVRRFRGEDSNLGVYLDRFTHRVSYPLMHLGMGVSLFRHTGVVSDVCFGAAVAYFYQLGVAHTLDKTVIAIQRGGMDLQPLRTVRQRITARLPWLAWPLKLLLSGYAQLIQNNTFVVLLSFAALTGTVRVFYLAYGSVVIGNWFLNTALDYGVAFRQGHQPVPLDGAAMGNLEIQMH